MTVNRPGLFNFFVRGRAVSSATDFNRDHDNSSSAPSRSTQTPIQTQNPNPRWSFLDNPANRVEFISILESVVYGIREFPEAERLGRLREMMNTDGMRRLVPQEQHRQEILAVLYGCMRIPPASNANDKRIIQQRLREVTNRPLRGKSCNADLLTIRAISEFSLGFEAITETLARMAEIGTTSIAIASFLNFLGNNEQGMSSSNAQAANNSGNTLPGVEQHLYRQAILDQLEVPSEWIPNEFICPISICIMDKPVSTEDGLVQRFNEANLLEWLNEQEVNPLTKKTLHSNQLQFDPVLDQQITLFMHFVRINISSLRAMHSDIASLFIVDYMQNRAREIAGLEQPNAVALLKQREAEVMDVTVKYAIDDARREAKYFGQTVYLYSGPFFSEPTKPLALSHISDTTMERQVKEVLDTIAEEPRKRFGFSCSIQ